MSNTTGAAASPGTRRAHTSSRTAARAAHRSPTVAGSNARTVRYSVGADATSPNRPSSARRYSISAHASPPPASINIAWVNTLPRSWTAARSPAHRTPGDKDAPTPNRSANAPNACTPTTPQPVNNQG